MNKIALIILFLLLSFVFNFKSINAAPPLRNLFPPYGWIGEEQKVDKIQTEIDTRIIEIKDIEKIIYFDQKEIKKAQDLINDAADPEHKQVAQDIILVKNKEIVQLKALCDELSKNINFIKQQNQRSARQNM